MNLRPPRPERGALTRLRYAPIILIIGGLELISKNRGLKVVCQGDGVIKNEILHSDN